MAYGTVRQEFITQAWVEASDVAEVLGLIDASALKASEGQLDYPPAEGKTNFSVRIIIDPLI